MSGFGSEAEILCSTRALPILTPMYGPAVRASFNALLGGTVRRDPAAALAKIDYYCRNQLVFTGGERGERHFHSASPSQVDGRRGHDRSACRAHVLPRVSHARGAPAYNPAARFDLAVTEVEFR